MEKYTSTQIANWENIVVFEEIRNDWTEEENGTWSTDKGNFEWWEELANAIEFLEENEIDAETEELSDYILIAKQNGF
ncbi:hypothetical protein Javan273_0001 [Streptococcus phage Javan273]|nr:hypothetical protein BKX95_00205 [Streptococcus iniae]QBX16743.1 hypothetical protein Javan273_0001 [Streptococcus phage Javan273]